MTDKITQQVKEILSEKYMPDSICVYYIEFKNAEQTAWRVEAEAYLDVEDGPYFFVFETNDGKTVRYWLNTPRKNNESLPGAEIITKDGN